jgi:hypothetical protein
VVVLECPAAPVKGWELLPVSLEEGEDELGVIVVRVVRVVGMTDDPLVTDVVWTTRLVKGDVGWVGREDGVIVVRLDCVVSMKVEPLDTEVVWTTRLVKGEVGWEDSDVGVIVVKKDRVVWMTDEPLVVTGVVCMIRLVKGDVAGLEVSPLGCDGLIVVKKVRVVDITTEPLVIRVGNRTVDVIGGVELRDVSGIVVVITSVRVSRVNTLVSNVRIEDPLGFVEWTTITVDIVDVIREVTSWGRLDTWVLVGVEETGLDGRDVLRVCVVVTEGEVESVFEDLLWDGDELEWCALLLLGVWAVEINGVVLEWGDDVLFVVGVIVDEWEVLFVEVIALECRVREWW